MSSSIKKRCGRSFEGTPAKLGCAASVGSWGRYCAAPRWQSPASTAVGWKWTPRPCAASWGGLAFRTTRAIAPIGRELPPASRGPKRGEILFVEAAMMNSPDEQLILTGMLGEVMRESARAALSYLRSEGIHSGIDPLAFDRKSLHIDIPAGAVPKDGPSAGATILVALASLARGRPARSDTAVTGEITLRGKILPVGGVREKVLAAERAGIVTIVLPRANERDLDDLPEDTRLKLHFEFVDSADEVLELGLS